MRESIIRNTERLKKNYQIIKLDGFAAVPFLIGELSFKYSGITTNEVLQGIALR